MKKGILTFLGMIILIALMHSFVNGYFHPHKVYLNDIKIDAPKNTFLMNSYINNKEVQNLLSPLYFANIEKYDLLQSKSINITFSNLDSSEIFSLLDISIKKYSLIDFKRLMSLISEDKSLNRILNKNKKCVIYTYYDDFYYHIQFYNFSKSIYVSLLSDKNKTIHEVMQKFCGKLKTPWIAGAVEITVNGLNGVSGAGK